MSSFTSIFTACEPLAWGLGLTSLAIYVPAWYRYKHMLDDAAVSRIENFAGQGLTTRQYRKAIDYYARSENSPHGVGDVFKSTYRWIRHPVASYRSARHAWQDMKSDLANIMPRGLRFLAIQEFFNIVGSTALEISAAFLYSHFGGEFSEALVVTIPVGSVLAHLRRVHVGLFTKRRIGIIRNGIEMGKSTIPTDIRIATPLILDGKTSSGS